MKGAPNIKIQRFSSINKEVGDKSSNNLITVNADWDLFVRLLITSNLPERCTELQTVFNPIFTLKEVIEKVFMSMLWSPLEKDIHVVQQLTASTNPKVVIINGVAVLYMTKSCGADTFDELFEKYFNIFSASQCYNNGLQIQYSDLRSCHYGNRTIGKIYCRSKRKGMAWII